MMRLDDDMSVVVDNGVVTNDAIDRCVDLLGRGVLWFTIFG